MPRVKLVKVEMVRDANVDETQRVPLTRPSEVVRWLSDVAASDREQFVCFHLNARNQVNAMEVVSVGSLNASLVHPRELFKSAILNNAASVVLAHNHPSGDTTPSKEDIALTKRMVEAGELLGIEVMDHVIVVPDGGFLSLREANLL